MIKKEEGHKILELLEFYYPAFQLKSGTKQLASSEQFLSEVARRTDEIERASHACSLRSLRYISEILTKEDVTIETGGGWTTCVFASYAKKHICVNPDITANELVKRFLEEHDVSIGELVFLNETSDTGLPALDKSCEFDVALIDGNHSFPIPILDWHYIDLHLKKGGIFLIDDSNIRSVKVLCEYLSMEKSYKRVIDIGNMVVYRKIEDNRVWGWASQEFNKVKNKDSKSLLNTILNRLLKHIPENLRGVLYYK